MQLLITFIYQEFLFNSTTAYLITNPNLGFDFLVTAALDFLGLEIANNIPLLLKSVYK